jgi:hypothetical protein
MTWDRSSANYDFAVAGQLTDVLEDVERFAGQGDFRKWRKAHDTWEPDGSQGSVTFEWRLRQEVPFESISWRGGLAFASWRPPNRPPPGIHYSAGWFSDTFICTVEYQFELRMTFEWQQLGTIVRTVTTEVIDPHSQAFRHDWFKAPTQIGLAQATVIELQATLGG